MKRFIQRGIFALQLAGAVLFAACGEDDAADNGVRVTAPVLGRVEVVDATLTHNAVTLKAALEDWGGDRDLCGLCWATVQNPTVDVTTKVLENLEEPGTFDVHITGLKPETEYFARAYARNRRGLIYSTQVQFKTLAESGDMMDYVEVGAVTLVGEPGRINASVNAQIKSDGGGMLRRAGVCIGLAPHPTVENGGRLVESSGAKVGTFTVEIAGLKTSTHYYVCAFGENAKGLVYGAEDLEFTTQEADVTLKGNAGPLLIGGTVEAPLGTNAKTDKIVEDEYNLVQIPCYGVAWNNWTSLTDYNLEAQKAWVDWAKAKGKKTVGHFLAAHNTYNPAWLNTGTFTKEQLIQILEDRVKAVVQTMGSDKVDMWTVVNEATVLKNAIGQYRDCVWSAIGTEPEESGMGYVATSVSKDIPIYIRLAFEFARKYAPDAQLILSDAGFELSLETDKRCCAFRQLVKHLQAKGVPIDAVAMQTHITFGKAGFENPETTPRWDLFEKHIKWFKAAGLKVYLNEIDLSMTFPAGTVLTEAQLELQKLAYKKCVNTAIDAGAEGFFFWGLGDGHDPAFRPNDQAQMYNYDHERKPAFFGVLEVLMGRYAPAN